MQNRYQRVNPKVSVLISTKLNVPERLAKLLEDLANQSIQAREIIIIIQRTNSRALASLTAHKFIAKFNDHLPLRYEIHDEIGLSKSRNRAIKAATGEILLLVDDDCRYPNDAIKRIVLACDKFPEANIFTFQVGSGQSKLPYKHYSHKPFRHNLRTLMKVCSIEIVLRRELLAHKVNLFDERFGYGTRWATGAENIMLIDLYRMGYIIQYVPIQIVRHSPRLWDRTFDANLIRAKGAMFHRIFRLWGLPLVILFLIKKKYYRVLKQSLPSSILQAIKGYFEFKEA